MHVNDTTFGTNECPFPVIEQQKVASWQKTADLLFCRVGEAYPQARERRFRLFNGSLDDFLNDQEVKSRFRFRKDTIEYITQFLREELSRDTRRNHALAPIVQVLVALRFYASGSFLQIIGDTLFLPEDDELVSTLFFAGLFTNIVARWPGSTHDAFIFRNSSIQNTLEREHTRIDEGYLLGDSGYPCRPFLMTPYPNPANQHQEDFNEAHSKTRVKIEQCFGLFKRRFHLMHGEVRMKPEKVSQLIGACAVLHNIAILRNDIYDGPAAGPDDEPDLNVYQGPEDGKIIRDFISNSYF
ncbi:uncharacterized protein LOC116605165 [Nematostella vectensis]|uniref:uncharacterized protein LOC116605165 n=1 Tax=Nematostella vectensis TaxID=45351 RepID=UPI002077577B|nr:uncharacterized protein LOC116605165 [Nematostella vectensis]